MTAKPGRTLDRYAEPAGSGEISLVEGQQPIRTAIYRYLEYHLVIRIARDRAPQEPDRDRLSSNAVTCSTVASAAARCSGHVRTASYCGASRTDSRSVALPVKMARVHALEAPGRLKCAVTLKMLWFIENSRALYGEGCQDVSLAKMIPRS
jgi:hypothetical protein